MLTQIVFPFVSLISQKRSSVTPQSQWNVLLKPPPYEQQAHNSGSWRPPEEQRHPGCPPACPQKVPWRYFCFITEGGKTHCVDTHWRSSPGRKLFFGKLDFLGMSKREKTKLLWNKNMCWVFVNVWMPFIEI